MKPVALFCIVLSMACCIGGGVTRAAPLSDDAKHAAIQSNEFGWDLYHRLAIKQKGNLLLSPYSIDTALAMTYGGARGQTAKQMALVLHCDQGADKLHQGMSELIAAFNSQHPTEKGHNLAEIVADALRTKPQAFELATANGLWLQKGWLIKPGFQKLVSDQYLANVQEVDFASGPAALEQARQTINDWVSQQTHDRIKDLLEPRSIDESSRLVLTNAIYFKSAWQEPFDKKLTNDQPFHTPSGVINVPTMHLRDALDYTEAGGVQVLALPYRDKLLSMVLILPQKNQQLSGVEPTLNARQIEQWLSAMKPRDIELSLPRFRFSSRFALGKTLQWMGMTEAFSNHADFSAMASPAKGDKVTLELADVFHQAFIDVDEEHTEAAAATAVGVLGSGGPASEPPPPLVFNADHPFVFVIYDRASATILFIGRIINPKE